MTRISELEEDTIQPTDYLLIAEGNTVNKKVLASDFVLDDGLLRVGTTAQRPISPPTGFDYFDTTINKPIWYDGTEWLEGSSGEFTTLKTELDITDTILNNTDFNISSSGTNYTMSGDIGNILTSSILFNDALTIQIELNGQRLDKSDDVVWVNSQTFQVNDTVDNNDKLIIFS